MSKPKKERVKIVLTAVQAEYNAVNAAYQAQWPRTVKLRERLRQAENLYLGMGTPDWSFRERVKMVFGIHPVVRSYIEHRQAVLESEQETQRLLAAREVAYKALVASQG